MQEQQVLKQKIAQGSQQHQIRHGESMPECNYCKEAHPIFRCESFIKLHPQNKYEEVRRLRLCINCLRPGHLVKACKSSSCKKCSAKYNTLLHKEHDQTVKKLEQDQTVKKLEQDQQAHNEELHVAAHCAPKHSSVILSTAEVYVVDEAGDVHRCRALFDSGSQTNMMSEGHAKRLNLKHKQVNLPVSEVNQSMVNVTKSVRGTLKSRVSSFTINQEFLLIPTITENLPQVRLELERLQVPDGIELAEPAFHESRPVDLLLGAAAFWKSLQPGENISVRNQPTFQNTEFGCIVGGECVILKGKPSLSVFHCVDLREQLEKFWKIEELNTRKKIDLQRDNCEKHFLQTHGRFQVRLPQNPEVVLGNSFDGAFQRLQSLERRFKKQPQLKEEYVKFIEVYKVSEHMSLLNEVKQLNTANVYYLPHQAVVRESSLTTKVRVVFDASHKTHLGTSLNDKLFPGPNLQNDLVDILLRFRCHQYVITADVKQMFRQIMVVDERDRDLQRILWREDPSLPIQIFTLNTVTYRTSCAPFLAMRCLRQLAFEARDTSPDLSQIVENDCYMDDLLTGSNTIEEAINLQHNLSSLLLRGQFYLRKWRANVSKILSHLSSERAEEFLVLDQDSGKTLGLLWNSTRDTLQYTDYDYDNDQVSKRKILSTIARIYNPLGLIGPVLITAKIFMQETWKCQLSWDDKVPAKLHDQWDNYVKSLHHLSTLEIRRNVNPKNSESEIVLHGFCDASERAYGACVYVTSTNAADEKQTYLLISKSRVAPLSTVTLPRLELQAAVLLAKLVFVVKQALRLIIIETHLWSDSTIAMCWIATPPSNLKTFISNRVAEIQELTREATWHHVPSKQNPADHLLRGVSAGDLSTLSIWWNGPSWIAKPGERPLDITQHLADVPEKRTIKVLTVFQDNSDLLRRFSSFTKLQRVIAYSLRFIQRIKKQKFDGALTVDELEAARIHIIRWLQEEAFPLDMNQLRTGKSVHVKSPLLSLKPFVDEHGLIRLGGRLQNTNLLHTNTNTNLKEEHVKLKHCGPQQLLFSIRMKYWPLSGAREARKVTRQCVSGFRYRPKIPKVIMGNLPASRVVEVSRPFETTGVDYAGPIMVRESKRPGRINVHKGYVVVIVCFSTKAVHLELVMDLTTESFLASLRRFTSRRGICKQIYSDNGVNFVGAAKELKEVYNFLSSNEAFIKNHLAASQIKWEFIPPRSPHFGGLWESAVKSMKRHLLTVIKNTTYTYEEYYTLLTEIEAVLNFRPLTPMSSEPNDLSILTPSHFLIGSSLPEPPASAFNI